MNVKSKEIVGWVILFSILIAIIYFVHEHWKKISKRREFLLKEISALTNNLLIEKDRELLIRNLALKRYRLLWNVLVALTLLMNIFLIQFGGEGYSTALIILLIEFVGISKMSGLLKNRVVTFYYRELGFDPASIVDIRAKIRSKEMEIQNLG